MVSLKKLIRTPSSLVWDMTALHNFSDISDEDDRKKQQALALTGNFQKHTGMLYSEEQIMSLVNKSSEVKGWYKLFKMEASFYMQTADAYTGLDLKVEDIKKFDKDWTLIKEARVKRAEVIKAASQTMSATISSENEKFKEIAAKLDKRAYVNLVRKEHIDFMEEVRISAIKDDDDREAEYAKAILEIKKRIILENTPGYVGEIQYPVDFLLF